MIKKIFTLVAALIVLQTVNVKADEGMWLPMLLKRNMVDMQKNGLKLTAEELYSVNQASLKDAIISFSGFCTGEIISDKGLILTNHHCGYDAVREASTVQNDLLTNGFFAKNMDEEIPSPGLYAKFLIRMDDVTGRVMGALTSDMDATQRAAKINEMTREIKAEAGKDNAYEIDVKSFFHGNEYYMFVYETFKDVRLVGAPPEAVGKFGGDTDNWMWPRHTGDFAMFRVYASADNKPAAYSKDNVPYKPRHFLPVNISGVQKNDFAMILGYPGSTDRFLTSHGVKMALDKSSPAIVKIRTEKLAIMKAGMDKDPAVRLQYASKYSQTSNYWKYFIGQQQGLKRNKVFESKQAEEKAFAEWVAKDEKRKEKYGTLMADFDKAYADYNNYIMPRTYLIEAAFQGPEVFFLAFQFQGLQKMLSDKTTKPEAIKAATEELKGAVAEHFLNYNEAIDKKLFASLFAMYQNDVAKEMHAPVFNEVNSKYKGDWKAYADKLFSKSIFTNEQRMNAFLAKPSAKTLNKDMGYYFMNSLYGDYTARIRTHTREYDQKKGELSKEWVAGLREMQPQRNFYPDANSTMRLTYGKVLDYNPMDAAYYGYITTTDGILQKEDPSSEEFVVPARLKELIVKKDFGRWATNGVMPVCFITDNDITGGNSGSSVINAKGELIGLAFDGNWEAMSGDIAFDKNLKRTINVDIRYVLFIIDKYHGAQNIINELKLVNNNEPAKVPASAPMGVVK